jgi:predicted CxxxxCH...CXXCH cytochrome family protein
MISTLIRAARGPFKTPDSMNSPLLVNAKGGRRFVADKPGEICSAISCHSSGVSQNMKSGGKRCECLVTVLWRIAMFTSYNAAASKSNTTVWSRIF